MYIKLNDMRNVVEFRMPFTGNSVFGQWKGTELYCVFSYGSHFPMYIYDKNLDAWVGNSDKYSSTTSRHQSKCKPNSVKHWLNTDGMKGVIYRGGYVEHVVFRGEVA